MNTDWTEAVKEMKILKEKKTANQNVILRDKKYVLNLIKIGRSTKFSINSFVWWYLQLVNNDSIELTEIKFYRKSRFIAPHFCFCLNNKPRKDFSTSLFFLFKFDFRYDSKHIYLILLIFNFCTLLYHLIEVKIGIIPVFIIFWH